MKIIVTNLTRMATEYICFAGIDPQTNKHIRPVLDNKRIPRTLAAKSAELFKLSSEIELGEVAPMNLIPEVEDHLFDPKQIQLIRIVPHEEFWQLLMQVAEWSVFDIFGKALRPTPQKHGYVVEQGTGNCSIGYMRLSNNTSLITAPRLDNSIQVRIKWIQFQREFSIGVTDIRLYDRNNVPRYDTVEKLSERLSDFHGVILCLGLTRAFSSGGDYQPVHWVQINNIILQENPDWFKTRW